MEIFLIKAFTDNENDWNPAWVILDSDCLTDQQMQNIATELGFSETVFVWKGDNIDYKFRFFSPIKEVDICAHASIAAIFCLNQFISKNLFIIETRSGLIEFYIENGFVVMIQKNPEFWLIENQRDKVAKLIWINLEDLMDLPIQTVSTWTPKLMIPIKSLDILFKIKPDFDWIIKYCEDTWCRWFYPFCFETIDKNSDIHARQFNPLAWINEDPITWIAAWALGCYLVENNILSKNFFLIEQWYIMKKFGKIKVEVWKNVKVGWNAVIYWKKKLFI